MPEVRKPPLESFVRADIVLYMRALFNGGTEQVMINLAGEFLRRGLKVTFLVDFYNPYSPFIERLPPGINYVELGAQGMVARFRKLLKFFRETPPKAFISGGYFPNIFAILARQVSGADTRLVVTEHNSPAINKKLSAPWEARRWFTLFARFVYPKAHAIVAVSNGTARDLALETGIPASKIWTIYNPIVNDALLAAGKQPLDDRWFVESDIPVIVAVGRLEPQKNYAALIRVLDLVRKEMPCRLIILGDGSERDMLQQLITSTGLTDSVRLEGFVANPHAFTSRAALLAMSSIWEGLPCVLIEALAVGTPIVATDCPFGPTEVLGGGRYGTLVPVNDDPALAREILRVLRKRPAPVPQAWLDQFTTSHAADQYLKLVSLYEPASIRDARDAVTPSRAATALE